MSVFKNFFKVKNAKKKSSSRSTVVQKSNDAIINASDDTSPAVIRPLTFKNVEEFCPFAKANSCTIVSKLKDDLALIQELTKTGSWKFNSISQELEWSDQTYEIFERNKKFPVTFNTFISYIHADDREFFKNTWDSVIKNGGTYDITHRIITSNNQIKWVRDRAAINSPNSIQNNCTIGTIQDVTERKLNEDSLKRMSTIFKAGEEGSIITDQDGVILDVNEAFCRVTGYSAADAIGKTPKILKSGIQPPEFYINMWSKIKTDGSWSGEVWNKKKNGEIYPEHLRIYCIKDENGVAQNYVSLFSDISETKKHIDQMQYLAYHDALTGLPNRMKLGKEISKALINADKNNQLCVVAYLDLDGFKPVNDQFGHNVGDLFLKDFATRINSCIRSHDLCARIGGDEFVLLLTEVKDDNEVEAALARLCNTITKPFIVDNNVITVSASIGVTIYPYDHNDPDTLLRHADMAMYNAKQNGKNQIKIFDSSNELYQVNKKKIRDDLEGAIKQNHLELYWQPYFNIATNEIIGAEALLRWNFNEEVLTPGEFLYAIEHDNLSVDVGNYALEHAFRVLTRLSELEIDISISVNLFQKQLVHPDFESVVLNLLQKYPQVKPKNLAFEILETTAIEDFEHVNELIDKFSVLGIKFAIDDFGTGYSSLSYFSKLHAQIIKIDRSFITNLWTDGADHAIVNSIMNLGKNFDKILIAEGVETEEQRNILTSLGCKIGQGYLFSKPITYAEFENMLLRQFKINK